MDRAGLRTARQLALWQEGLEILDGITVDGEGDAESHMERLVNQHARQRAKHQESGTLEAAEKQLRGLAIAADGMAAALGQLGLEARQAIFGGGLGADHDEFLRDGYPFEGGWLPNKEGFTEFAKACRNQANSCGSLPDELAGMPHFLELLQLTPKQLAGVRKFRTAAGGLSPNRALVMGCEDALLRVGRTENLKSLVRIVAELATGTKPSARFAEREIQMYSRAHNAQDT